MKLGEDLIKVTLRFLPESVCRRTVWSHNNACCQRLSHEMGLLLQAWTVSNELSGYTKALKRGLQVLTSTYFCSDNAVVLIGVAAYYEYIKEHAMM